MQDSNPVEPAPQLPLLPVVPLHLQSEPVTKLRYEDSLYGFFLPYIRHVGEVKSDENYGFRVNANSPDISKEQWCNTPNFLTSHSQIC